MANLDKVQDKLMPDAWSAIEAEFKRQIGGDFHDRDQAGAWVHEAGDFNKKDVGLAEQQLGTVNQEIIKLRQWDPGASKVMKEVQRRAIFDLQNKANTIQALTEAKRRGDNQALRDIANRFTTSSDPWSSGGRNRGDFKSRTSGWSSGHHDQMDSDDSRSGGGIGDDP
jgi:hypothetical protein